MVVGIDPEGSEGSKGRKVGWLYFTGFVSEAPVAVRVGLDF